MSMILWGVDGRSLISDPDGPRSTVTVVTDDAPPMAPSEPQAGEQGYDPVTGGGLTSHAVSAHTVPRRKTVPERLSRPDVHTLNQIRSSVGTAAAREDAGQHGNGTLLIRTTVTPHNAPSFGETHFLADRHDIRQDSALTPSLASDDPRTRFLADAAGKAAARVQADPDAWARFMEVR